MAQSNLPYMGRKCLCWDYIGKLSQPAANFQGQAEMLYPESRFVSHSPLSKCDFLELAQVSGIPLLKARKIGLVSARPLKKAQRIITLWNGQETVNQGKSGDVVVTNLDTSGQPIRDSLGNRNIYIIDANRFPQLYEPVGPSTRRRQVHRPKSVVQALKLEGGFDIVAPWGERQRADSGYLILNGEEVYGNHTETFERTYEVINM